MSPLVPIQDKARRGEAISSGAFKRVYEHPDNERLVVKDTKNEIEPTPEEREKWHLLSAMEFYLTKIAHILNPKDIPDIHLISTKDDMLQSIHKRVPEVTKGVTEEDLLSKLYRKIQYIQFELNPDPERIAIQERFKDAGIDIDVRNPANFGRNEDKTLTYVDSPYFSHEEGSGHIRFITNTDVTKLEDAIDALADDQTRRRAKGYLDRFNIHLRMYQEHHTAQD